jgi:TrkA domain protein
MACSHLGRTGLPTRCDDGPMAEVEEFRLPGVGIRYEFTTKGGDRLAVVSHRSGRREVFIGDPRDPDAFKEVTDLAEDESRTLAELLGGTRVTEHLTKLRQTVEGLAIDWLPVDADSPFVGRTIGDARVRTRTGVSVVAILKGESAVPAPGPEQVLEADDTLVVIGTPKGIEATVEILHVG